MHVAGNLHQLGRWARHGEKLYLAGTGIEAAHVVIGRFGEPDYPLGINGYTVGVDCLYALFACKWVLLNEACTWIQFSQGVGVQLGEPYVAVCIERQVVWRA